MSARNLHLPHAEEVPILLGAPGLHIIADGFMQALEYLRTGQMPATLALSEKFDGAPAVCIGLDSIGVWVGTKSALRINSPMRYHSVAEVYKDFLLEAGLVQKLANLIATLEHFEPKHLGLKKHQILCGDLSHSLPPTERLPLRFFQPNVLRYTSGDGLHERARVGIVLHTIRSANPAADYDILSFEPRIELRSDRLSITSASLPRRILPNSPPNIVLSGLLDVPTDLQFLLDDISSDAFLKTTICSHMVNQKPNRDMRKGASELRKSLQLASERRIRELKTAAGQDRARRKDSERLEKFTPDRTMRLMELLRDIKRVKESIMDYLPRPLCFSASYEDKLRGVLPCSGEGFVLHRGEQSCGDSHSFKLVKREEFSAINFSSTTVRGFELL